ncbi:hypothetical protein [Massilia antarctica]|uniref:hypothetical protein n=1 Tax=Massilia antarctica TaxID=2765360 RepID=UPI00227025C0|nr:hypothetical protein [Massilia sp. H27-R4]MCY0914039.1 hypothetical protein [Massilia sp. H27-R4]
MNKKSALEKVTGHAATSALTNVAAVLAPVVLTGVTPLVALLPFLVNTLAANRQTARLEECIKSLSEDVARLGVDTTKLSDDQFKLAGECSVALFSTISTVKLDYLKRAVLNAMASPAISSGVSDALGRLVRDISAVETDFVIKAFEYKSVNIDGTIVQTERTDTLVVRPDSTEDMLVGGLIRLGLLYSKGTSWDATMYEWSPLTAKFIALVSPVQPLPIN